MAKKQNTIRNKIDDFVGTVEFTKDEMDNSIRYLDEDTESLKKEYLSLKAKEAIVGANGSREDFLKVREDLRKNEDLQDYNEARKKAFIKAFEDSKQNYINQYNDIRKANYIEALKKCLPHLEALRQITDEAEANNEALEAVRSLFAKDYQGIDILTSEHSAIVNIAKDVNDIQLNRVKEALKDGSK